MEIDLNEHLRNWGITPAHIAYAKSYGLIAVSAEVVMTGGPFPYSRLHIAFKPTIDDGNDTVYVGRFKNAATTEHCSERDQTCLRSRGSGRRAFAKTDGCMSDDFPSQPIATQWFAY